MAASRARLEALLARVQKRASEPRTPSSSAPILEAVRGGASPAAAAEAPASARPAAARAVAASAVLARAIAPQNVAPQNEIGDEDIEEYDDELIEIIDDAEVIPQAAAVARAIEPAAFGAAVDRRPSAPIRSEPAPARPFPARPSPEAVRPEAVAARPIATSEVARARGPRRELRHTSFTELLDASLKLG
jgi:hypothetical protein